MKKYLLMAALFAASASISAQNVCTIKGTIGNKKLRFSDKEVKMVYLNQMDELENCILVDSAKVAKDGSFTFKHTINKENQPLVYLLTGFDNGAAHFWVEPGTVTLEIPDANYPVSCKASGTITNELEAQFTEIRQKCIQVQVDSLHVFARKHGNEWLDTDEGMLQRKIVGSQAVVKQMIDKTMFILNHTDSPMAPLFMKKELMWDMNEQLLIRIVRSMHPSLYNHPYYKAFKNAVLAKFMKEGSELPDITLQWKDGSKGKLSDFRGKYVLLDFWASWCGPCRKEIPHLIKLRQDLDHMQDRFVIISFSLDNDKNAWQKAIKDNTIDLEGWLHASDLKGWQSPEATLLGINAVPKTFLLSPAGEIIAIDLRGDEMVRKVKMLIAQDEFGVCKQDNNE